METAICGVLYFRELNGKTIVDCSCLGLSRDVKKLHAVALPTGLNIIAGSGYYTVDTHPPQMDQWSAEEIAEQIVRELTEGIDETQIKAGVIGEVGTSEPIHPNEEKNLIAAAMAFQKTGAPVYVHTYPWGRSALQAVETLLGHGASPDKIVVCHLDVEPDTEYIKAVLDMGVFLEFDNFGKEFRIDATDGSFAGGNFCRDIDRVRIVKKLVEWGYGKQVLITNDICLKGMLRAYGGRGYAHILKNIFPMMRQEGIDQETVTMFMQDNPKRLFS